MKLYDNIDFSAFDPRSGRPRTVYNSDSNEIGIEIEFSGNSRFPDIRGFHRTSDPSVRGSYSGEYVLDTPCTIDNLMDVLEPLDRVVSRYDNDEPSTSVHVHLNVQDSEIEHIMNMAGLYFMFEDAIMNEYCKPSRKKNHFCLGFFDAPYITQLLYNIVSNAHIDFLNEEDIKYASVNFQTLTTYGTLEFRALHGTVNKQEIFDWVSMLKRIKDLASQYSGSEFIREALSDYRGMAHYIFDKDVEIDEDKVHDVIYDLKPALLAKLRVASHVKLIEPRTDV